MKLAVWIVLVTLIQVERPNKPTANTYLDSFTPQEVEQANTAKGTSYLSEEEQKVILYTNLARMYPKRFRTEILIPFVANEQWERTTYYRSLSRELNQLKPLPALHPQEDLYKEAKRHALDLGKAGKVGHKTSRGKSFAKRMEELGESYYGLSENCQYGWDQGLHIVLDLLIDNEVKNLGHRKNMLNGQFLFVGVAIEPHKRFVWNSVMDFGSERKS